MACGRVPWRFVSGQGHHRHAAAVDPRQRRSGEGGRSRRRRDRVRRRRYGDQFLRRHVRQMRYRVIGHPRLCDAGAKAIICAPQQFFKCWIARYNRGRPHNRLGTGVLDSPQILATVRNAESGHRLGEGVVVLAPHSSPGGYFSQPSQSELCLTLTTLLALAAESTRYPGARCVKRRSIRA